jgi:aspartate carbamoyltransferase catalytic subunit
MLKNKDILGIKQLSVEEIDIILNTAVEMKKILNQNVKKVPHLQNKSVVTLFYENSTRTRTSFETAAKFMSASVSNINVSTSSVAKGETLIDTGKTLDALKTDIIIIRHSMAGAPHLLAKNVKANVINGGDGMNEHPTQALLDMFTIKERFGKLNGLKIGIFGDILHSRVARSNIWGLTKMGAKVKVFAPETLMPPYIENTGAVKVNSMEELIDGCNAVIALRIQSERQKKALIPAAREYSKYYGLNEKMLELVGKDTLIMHPGPINRGLEICSAAENDCRSVITQQVTNGVAVRMALLFLLTRGGAQ